MIVEGYTIHLYCDDPTHVDSWHDIGEFCGYRIRRAFREARVAGWQFYSENGERKTRCPKCVERNRKRPDQIAPYVPLAKQEPNQ